MVCQCVSILGEELLFDFVNSGWGNVKVVIMDWRETGCVEGQRTIPKACPSGGGAISQRGLDRPQGLAER